MDAGALNNQIKAKLDDDGLIRAHGRLEEIRSLPYEMRNPIILPRNHPLARILTTSRDARVQTTLWLQAPDVRSQAKILDNRITRNGEMPHQKMHSLSKATWETSGTNYDAHTKSQSSNRVTSIPQHCH